MDNTKPPRQRLNRRPDEDVGPPVVQIRNLWTRFGRTVVHQDLNLDIFAGEILSIVGGSGTGTTVLLRQMLGLERPSSGSVTVFGEDVSSASPEQLQRMRNHWGMLFQEGALYSALTVFDNIALPLRELRALPEDVIRDAVLLKMTMVGLGPGDANKMPSDLSGGMVKRAALARALALEPQLLFLDEPTADPDPAQRTESDRGDGHARPGHAVRAVHAHRGAGREARDRGRPVLRRAARRPSLHQTLFPGPARPAGAGSARGAYRSKGVGRLIWKTDPMP
jgi:ABC-type transporter Mla maintaining outer membrane lipid asymmetry ATPase subunit MlaF